MPEPAEETPPAPEPQPDEAVPTQPTGAQSAFWPAFVASLRGEVPPSALPYLHNPAKVTGVWKNGRLTLWVDGTFTRSVLHKPAVLQALTQAAAAFFHVEDPQVAVMVGQPPQENAAAKSKDALDDLLAFGSQYDNIKIQ